MTFRVLAQGGGGVHGAQHIIARVTLSQCSYRAELLRAAIVSHLAEMNDSLAMDNHTVVMTVAQPLHRECADIDLTQEAHTNFSLTLVHIK